MPEFSSFERVKLGPPTRNSRAIRLATMLPSAPMVLLAVSGGPAASRSESVHAASSSAVISGASIFGPGSCLFGQGPAEAEVGGVEVEGNADEDPCPHIIFAAETGVGHGSSRCLKHEELLGEHLLHFPGRDAELLGSKGKVFQVESLERSPVQSFRFEPVALQRSPPFSRGGGRSGLITAQNPLLKRAKRLPGAEAGVHADNRYRFVLGAECRVPCAVLLIRLIGPIRRKTERTGC